MRQPTDPVLVGDRGKHDQAAFGLEGLPRARVSGERGPDSGVRPAAPASGEWTLDLALDVVRGSDEWWRLRGRRPAESRTWVEWRSELHPEDATAVAAAVEAVRWGAEDHFKVAYRERHRDGGWVWISAHGWREEAQSGAACIVGADTDITHLKRSERAVTALSRRLE